MRLMAVLTHTCVPGFGARLPWPLPTLLPHQEPAQRQTRCQPRTITLHDPTVLWHMHRSSFGKNARIHHARTNKTELGGLAGCQSWITSLLLLFLARHMPTAFIAIMNILHLSPQALAGSCRA